MSQDWYQDVVDFHKEVMGDNFPVNPYIPPHKYSYLRYNLVKEEMEETINAILQNDVVGIADGIADSIVVLLGTAVTYGIDIRPVWDEVHKTNMAKKGGKLREDGKMLKQKDWKSPDIVGILRRQGYES